jgi:hypothetical protein
MRIENEKCKRKTDTSFLHPQDGILIKEEYK